MVKPSREFNKEWSQANITQVFSRRFLKKGKGTTRAQKVVAKNKVTYWNLDKEQTSFDSGRVTAVSSECAA